MATQGEVVFQAVRTIFKQENYPVVPPTTEWSEAQKKAVHDIIFTAFRSGLCVKSSGGQSDEDLLKYIPGLTNNWVRKDLRLNGGAKYVPKNPGSRSNGGDEVMKNLRLLLQSVTDESARQAVQAEIDKRAEQLKPKIDLSLLPDSLKHLVK